MKQLLVHGKYCDKQIIGGCKLCKIFMSLCYFHMNNCQKSKCVVPFCSPMKHKSNQSLYDLTSKDYEILGLVPMPVPMGPVTQNPRPSDDSSQESVADSLEPAINESRPDSRLEPSPFFIPSIPAIPGSCPEKSASLNNRLKVLSPGQQIKKASNNKRPIKFSNSQSAQSASPHKRPKILTGHKKKPVSNSTQLPTNSKGD